MLVPNGWQPSEISNGTKNLLLESGRLKMAYQPEVFFLVYISQIPCSFVVLEGVEDRKFH
jgi:hypothetical protein